MMSIALLSVILAAVLLAVYFRYFHGHLPEIYSPPAAWLRAGIYFCFCLLAGVYSGALQAVLADPLVHPGQLENPWWLASTLVVTVTIVAGYWGYWYHHTIRFERKLHVPGQLVFGLCWGFTSGLLFLAFWHMALAVCAQWPVWTVWLMSYVMISIWQALFIDLFWNVYIAPEHDSPKSLKTKLPRSHVPNMTLCLTWFAIYQNYWLFIALQTLALLAASFGMRFPPPWSKQATPAARRIPGLLGLSRAGGYLPDDPASDPYLKAANLDG